MVNRLIFLFSLVPIFLFSGEFTASVNRNQVKVGESFTLSLILKEASAKTSPSVDQLNRAFHITSQQQFYNTVMTNGRISSSTTWKYVLIPKTEGELFVPPISIDTQSGILLTEAIRIQATKGANESVPSNNDVILTTDLSNVNPYKNEPLLYTIRLVSGKDLSDVKLPKVHLDNAMIEENGEPKVQKKIVDGVPVNVIEFEYLITPLKAGLLKIPSFTIQGLIYTKRRALGRSIFDDDFDPFSMMGGFERPKPFALATEELVLNVQAAIADMSPWLPARSLKIEEVWDESQLLQVGQPFTRGIKIVGEGIKSSQLPSLSDLQVQNNQFKIYADKPELSEDGKNGNIKSHRHEQYTLIPQQQGLITLPEISIVWWDVSKKEKVIARIPSRTLQIQPASEIALEYKELPALVEPTSESKSDANPLLYVLIGGLVFLLSGAVVWGVALQKRITQLTTVKPSPLKNPEQKVKPPKPDKREKLPDLNPT